MVESTIISKKMIKPSSPTSSSLRCHNFSFLDQLTYFEYTPIASFYSKPQKYNINQISDILEKSLSKVLSSYYPFAGKIMDNKYVDCNDQGVEYLNVQINCSMSQLLNNPYVDALDVVFPQDLPWNTTSLPQSPLVVQLSHFDCGGLAVSICISHKIVDGYSIGQFLKDWASTARDDQLNFKPSPWFGANSLFPPKLDDPPIAKKMTREPQRLSKAYHFSSSNLGRLKDIVVATNSGVVHNPTSIEVATALLHKCGVVSSSTLLSTDENHPPTTTSMFKPSLLMQVMNLRPPLPLNAIGTVTYYFTSIATSEDEIQVPNFVDQLGKAKQHVKDKLKDINVNELGSRALEESKVAKNIMADDDFYWCSSLRNFGLYTIDFGWGRPIRVTPASHPRKKKLIFLDDPNGDGIHVVITLSQHHMLLFQNNKDLLEFASPIGISQNII